MAQSAPGIEKHTLLGPFFRLSPLQGEAVKSYFPGPRSLDKTRISTAQDALRMVLRAHQDDLFVITNAFIRAGADTRSRTLDWFAYIMNTNHKRRGMRVDPREVASDGFMINVTTILDRFCEPFMDNDFSKVDKIDDNYFRKQPRVDIKDETKINADQAHSDSFYANKVPGEANFISEAFFLTLAAHHYGSEACNSQLKGLDRDLRYFESRIEAMEAERPRMANVPDQAQRLEAAIAAHVRTLENAISKKYAIEGVLLDERMQSTSLRFMRYVAVWLLRLVTRSKYKPGLESSEIKYVMSFLVSLPCANLLGFLFLPSNQMCFHACRSTPSRTSWTILLSSSSECFRCMHVSARLTGYRWIPKILPSAIGDEMIALCVTFLRSTEYIKNPYLKSSLVSLLFSSTWPLMHLKRGVLGDQLVGSKFANEHLLRGLMRFYIECESTGADSAFYDKFNIRYEIFQVIKCVWVNDHYKRQLAQESK
jgi:ubiquitin conjugation factor E4 B